MTKAWKKEQRLRYHEDFKGVKHNHGGRPVKRKQEAALGLKLKVK